MTAVPCDGVVTFVTVSVSSSGSLSFDRTGTTIGAPSLPDASSSVATGGDCDVCPPTTMRNACGALVSTPPLAVPPLSWIRTETVAEPDVVVDGVNVSVPAGETAGWTLKIGLLSLLTMKSRDWNDSLAGPALSDVAQFGTDCAPALSGTL